MFSNWGSARLRRGVFAKPVKISKFVLPEYKEGVEGVFWRDLPHRRALDERLEAYFEPLKWNADEQILRIACDSVFEKLDQYLEVREPSTFAEAWSTMPSGTSSGYPEYVKKSLTRNRVFYDYVKDLRALRQGKTVNVFPASTASRSVIREIPENKPRLVWVYPVDMTIKEAVFARPLIDQLKRCPLFGYSWRWLERGSGYWKWRTLAKDGQFALMADYKQFDSRVAARLIRLVFRYFKSKFKLNLEMARQFDLVTDYFINTPIIWHDGVKVKHRGIPSGSYFTQLIGSIVNLIYNEYFMIRADIPDHLRTYVCVLGDDSLSHFSKSVWWLTILEKFKNITLELGAVVSDEKSKISVYNDEKKEAEFLGMVLTDESVHMKVDLTAVKARLCLPESEDKHPFDLFVRIIGLAWSYGYHTKAYKLLRNQYNALVREYPDLPRMLREDQSNIRDPEVARWFNYVLDEHGIDMNSFPVFDELRFRYLGYR